MTKREMFAVIADLCADNAEVVDFCNHEIELLNARKNHKSDKPSKAQRENAELAEVVFEFLMEAGGPVAAADVVEGVENPAIRSTQKVSALMKMLIADGRVVKRLDGKKVFFAVAEAEAEVEGE